MMSAAVITHPQPLPWKGGKLWSRSLQLLTVVWAGLLLLFWRDAADMAAIWWNSSTFNHCLIILPIIGWLVMQRTELLTQLTPQSWWPPLLYIGAGAFGWLLGDAAGVAVARHLGLCMMLQGSVAVLLGPNVTRGLLFPLFFLFFLVPIGEELVPPLQTLTAQMCMLLLHLTGVPTHIEGIFISTPVGLFRVAEACSGIEFLIAMVALGALIANLCFKSWGRRIAFMVACIAVPVIANGLRAFGTIYIAQSAGIEFAAGFDHIVFGWVFFAVVIAIVIGGAWRWFDKRADEPAFDPARLQGPVRFAMPTAVALAAALAIPLAPAAWSALVSAQSSPVPPRIYLPEVPGWQVVPYNPHYDWRPRFDGNSHYLLGRYRNEAGQYVDLYIAVFDRQSEGRELVGFGQGAVDPDSEWSWSSNGEAPANGKAEHLLAPGQTKREVVSFYRVNGVTSGSATTIKLATLKARLLGGNQQAVSILVSAEQQGRQLPRPAIDAFLRDIGNIDNLADRMAGLD